MTPIARVVDLSHYDDVQDKFKGAVDFGIWGVINKVTDGVGMIDKSFAWRRQPCADAGLLYGAYHFFHTGRVEQQAQHFLDGIGDPKGLLLALDYENDEIAHTHPTIDEAKQWLGIIHDKVGRWPWIYSGNLIKEQLGNSRDPFWANIKLWLAQYGTNPISPPAFAGAALWQYSGDGAGQSPHNVPGIVIGGAGIDMNHFGGTRDQLEAIWAA